MANGEAPTVGSGSTVAPIAPVAPIARDRGAPTLGGLGELLMAVALLVMLASLAR